MECIQWTAHFLDPSTTDVDEHIDRTRAMATLPSCSIADVRRVTWISCQFDGPFAPSAAALVAATARAPAGAAALPRVVPTNVGSSSSASGFRSTPFNVPQSHGCDASRKTCRRTNAAVGAYAIVPVGGCTLSHTRCAIVSVNVVTCTLIHERYAIISPSPFPSAANGILLVLAGVSFHACGGTSATGRRDGSRA
jgi:hypothetical protein